MKKILLTGMSGVGKTTVMRHLKTPNNITIDFDYNGWMIDDALLGEEIIDIPRVLDLFEKNPHREIILVGTAINQGQLYPYLDGVITLTAPLSVMRERILNRTDNPFGKSAAEWSKICADTYEVEPLLIRRSDLVLSTDCPLENIIKKLQDFLAD